MESLSQCKSGREIVQFIKDFTITNAADGIFSLTDIEGLTVTSVVAAEGKAMVSLAGKAGDIYAIAVNETEKCITLYSLES